MINARLTTTILILIILVAGCGSKEVVEDPRRKVVDWDPPQDFRPSKITRDQDGIYHGLFVSRMYSAKFNLWMVSSRDSINWINPTFIMNAYSSDDINFIVRNDSVYLTYFTIDPSYFEDYGLGLAEFVDYKDELNLAFALKDLKRDRDRDGIYDNIEGQLLISYRLPDTDLDGKPDLYDFCPLSKPRPQTKNHRVYHAVLEDVIETSNLDQIKIQRDTAWTKYFRLYTLQHPTPLYLSFADEKTLFELQGFPMPLIMAKTPLWFGSRIEYRSFSDDIIPHLNFKKVAYNFLRAEARVYVDSYVSDDSQEEFEFHVKKDKGKWVVKTVRLILPPEEQTQDTSELRSENPDQ